MSGAVGLTEIAITIRSIASLYEVLSARGGGRRYRSRTAASCKLYLLPRAANLVAKLKNFPGSAARSIVINGNGVLLWECLCIGRY